MLRLLWYPTFRCNNYGPGGEANPHCRYCDLNYDIVSQRVTLAGEAGASGIICDPAKVVDFLKRNAEVIGREFDMAGGEPLMHRELHRVVGELSQAGFRWSITSNTLIAPAVERLCEWLQSCNSWTVSIHAYGGVKWERLAANVRRLRAAGGIRRLSGTIVISEETLPILQNMEAGGKSLPLDGLQYHIDQNSERPEFLISEARRLLSPGSRVVVSGYQPQGVMCHRRGVFLVLNPDGVLYECSTKAYRGIDPIGAIENIDLRNLSGEAGWCDLKCSSACNHPKHVVPAPAAFSL